MRTEQNLTAHQRVSGTERTCTTITAAAAIIMSRYKPIIFAEFEKRSG